MDHRSIGLCLARSHRDFQQHRYGFEVWVGGGLVPILRLINGDLLTMLESL
jgi:hypothetical protein